MIENSAKYIAETFFDKSKSRLDLLKFVCETNSLGLPFTVEMSNGNLLFTLKKKSIATMHVSSDLLHAVTLREWHDKLTCIMKRMLPLV